MKTLISKMHLPNGKQITVYEDGSVLLEEGFYAGRVIRIVNLPNGDELYIYGDGKTQLFKN